MLAAVIVVAVILLDQLSKALVVANIELGATVPVVPGIIRFAHTENTGAAFSILSDAQWVYMVLSVVAIAALVYLIIRFYRRHILLTISLSCILGGGIGNMIDRVLNVNAAGKVYVVDFLEFEFVDFAIFNVADVFVTCGAVLLGVYVVFFERQG